MTDHALRKDSRARRIITGAYVGDGEARAVPSWADSRWKEVYTTVSAVQDLRPDAVASHWSAAVLHGLPVPRGVPDAVQVTTPNSGSQVRITGIRGHRSRHLVSEELLDIRVTPIPFTLAQIAPDLDHENAIVVLEALMGDWHGGPHARHVDLARFLERTKHFAGRSVLRRALVDSRSGTGSPKETELRRALIHAGLPEPSVQPAVWLPRLSSAVHPDMAYVEKKLAVEYEGDHHRTDVRQWETDIRRYEALAEAGWHIIRVTRRTPTRNVVDSVRRHLGRGRR
ncbi:hypothetical protein GCM10022261_20600 [Brevibacterium daeguense]|uniref:DUF559 domain-containing protein n=1 Tax=Brevibacterium daeguense TaxID=909936 RepID=A0ABP8EKM1_9MICO|nr:endonuclease domain-containing protein [Brevibacterium daeguense]